MLCPRFLPQIGHLLSMSNVKETLDETVGLYDKWSGRYNILYIQKKKRK